MSFDIQLFFLSGFLNTLTGKHPLPANSCRPHSHLGWPSLFNNCLCILSYTLHSLHFCTCNLFEIMEYGQGILQKCILISTECRQLQGDFVPLDPTRGKPPNPLTGSRNGACHAAKKDNGNAPPLVKHLFKRLCYSWNLMLDCSWHRVWYSIVLIECGSTAHFMRFVRWDLNDTWSVNDYNVCWSQVCWNWINLIGSIPEQSIVDYW